MSSSPKNQYRIEKQNLLRFIRIFKGLPALWNTKSHEYSNKLIKCESYQRFVDEFRAVDSSINVDQIKRKINVLRTTHRREIRKIKASNTYRPLLWYFQELNFLEVKEGRIKQEPPFDVFEERMPNLTDNSEGEGDINHLHREPAENMSSTTRIASGTYLTDNTDGIDLMGRVWSIKLKNMPRDQRLYAEKAINDIILEGELGTLTQKSVRINERELLDRIKCDRNSFDLN